MDVRHRDRLRHTLALLTARGINTPHARLACHSGVGFSRELRAAQKRGEVILVAPERLYAGT
ncbi:hypothetical protein ABII15_23925 [Streptomyces sp. HUAS MG91]|uniref:Uncharacterized protein n=1 Tax=Streptomyces tabacisoli TaxID=3156398 RepID=A0AAU8IYB2_9ACTN